MINISSNSARRTFSRKHLRIVFIWPCFILFTVFVSIIKSNQDINENTSLFPGRHLLESSANDTDGENCPEPSILSFPQDFFSQEQRRKGGVIVHFIILLYMCAMLTIVVDEYFVPSLDIVSEKLNLPPDVAGATFMAIGTSAPELYSAIIGSFITEGDIGIGTIVGSAVFNLLCVTGLAGVVVWSDSVPVDWYPVTRDSTVYTVTIAALTGIISDNAVQWWEALILLVMFAMYIIIMYYNSYIEAFCLKQAKKFRDMWGIKSRQTTQVDEKTPLLSDRRYSPEIKSPDASQDIIKDSYSVEIKNTEQVIEQDGEYEISQEIEDDDEISICSPPSCDSFLQFIWWLIMWPASLLFYITIPDSRKTSCYKFFAVTFAMSTVWLGVLTYMCAWMVTVIGTTFYIPDTVSGLTLLAAGTSLPEVLSSIIVVKSGLGNMVMANLIGSNVFDILFCLGAPWFIKALASREGYVVINSSALTYTTTTLLITVIGLFIIFNVSSWKLNKNMGFVCLLVYVIFVVLACLYELNILGNFNTIC